MDGYFSGSDYEDPVDQRSLPLTERFSRGLLSITKKDDEEEFQHFLRSWNPSIFVTRDGYLEDHWFQPLIYDNAVNCAKALLDGKCPCKVDLHHPFEDYDFSPLHQAAYNGRVEMARLFVRYGAPTNFRNDNGYLPLNFAVENISPFIERKGWTTKDSIFRLITLVFTLDYFLKRHLDVTRLLAQHTDELLEELLNYIDQGQVIEVAVLFLVAQKKIMAITVQDKHGRVVSGMQRIRNHIIASQLSNHNEKVQVKAMGCHDDMPNYQCQEKKDALVLCNLLVEVFEKVGDALDGYLQTDHTEDEAAVIENVKSILECKGFDLGRSDIIAGKPKFTPDRQVGDWLPMHQSYVFFSPSLTEQPFYSRKSSVIGGDFMKGLWLGRTNCHSPGICPNQVGQKMMPISRLISSRQYATAAALLMRAIRQI